jgi:3-oxoacyl-[acyl-carrier protein] reductase
MNEFLALDGKVAVVTGGASGLGQAVARGLAREGARVVLGDIDAAGLERTVAELGAQVRGKDRRRAARRRRRAVQILRRRRSGRSRSWSSAPASSARRRSPA